MFFEKIIHGSNQTILNFELILFSEKLKQYLLICSDVPFTGTVHAWFHSQKMYSHSMVPIAKMHSHRTVPIVNTYCHSCYYTFALHTQLDKGLKPPKRTLGVNHFSA